MATEFNREISALEIRLQTSIRYHDWFLGFVVVVGVLLSIYLVKSMNALQEGLFEVRAQILVMQKDIGMMHKDTGTMTVDIDTMKADIEIIKADVETLNYRMDRYHGSVNPE